MPRILLVTPLNLPFTEAIQKSVPEDIKRKLDPKYPIGLLNIGSYVEAYSNSTVNILDYNTEISRYFKDTKDKSKISFNGLLEYGITHPLIFAPPNIIGISALFSSNYRDMDEVISFFSYWFPTSIIVLGGHLASACYKEFLLNFPTLHAVCYGEGEIPFMNLVEAFRDNRTMDYLEKNPSWITKKNLSDPTFKPINMVVEDLDTIPPYNLEMLKFIDDYSNTNADLFSLGTSIKDKDEKELPLFATRGCPYHCIFCGSQFVHGHKVRSYSLTRVKEDVIYYNQKYGITSFPFLDDHFLANKKFAIEIMNFIYNKGWSCRIFNLSYIHLDRELIRTLKRTGSDRAVITIDGVNESFLRKVVKKPANFKKAREIIRIFREEGLPVLANIIIGFPGEDEQSINEGVKTIQTMGANWYAVLTAAPLHGSELYDLCKKNNYIVEGTDVITGDYRKAVIKTENFTPEWITEKAYEINLRLNFVENYDMKGENNEIALMFYDRIINVVEKNHAFAFYFGAICAKKLNKIKKYEQYKNQYNQIVNSSSFWKNWAEYFKLKDLI